MLQATGGEKGEDRGWGHSKQKPQGLSSPIPERQALLCEERQPSALADGAQSLQGSYSCLPPAVTHIRHRHGTGSSSSSSSSCTRRRGHVWHGSLHPHLPLAQAAAKPGLAQPLPLGMSAQKSRSTPGSFLSILLTIKEKRKKPLCLATAQREGRGDRPGGRSLLIPTALLPPADPEDRENF